MEAKLTMKVKAILEDELLNWETIEKWSVIEVDELLWQYLLRAYWDRREKVEEEVVETEETETTDETTDEDETEETTEEETEENEDEEVEEEVAPKSTRSRK